MFRRCTSKVIGQLDRGVACWKWKDYESSGLVANDINVNVWACQSFARVLFRKLKEMVYM